MLKVVHTLYIRYWHRSEHFVNRYVFVKSDVTPVKLLNWPKFAKENLRVGRYATLALTLLVYG